MADLQALDRQTGRGRGELELMMLADGLIAMTEALGLGCLDGRYANVERAVDVLVEFARGVLT
jgi:hypothetical protein